MHVLRQWKKLVHDLAAHAFQRAGRIVIAHVVDLRQRIGRQVAALRDAGKDRKRLFAQVLKLRAEQRHGQLVAFQRVFHGLQRVHHLQEGGARLRPAFGQFCAHIGCAQAQRLEGFLGRVAAVDRADRKFLDRVAHFVDLENAVLRACDERLHHVVGGQAHFGILRRVLAQYVQQIAVAVRAVLRAHGDQVISLLRRNAEFVHQGGRRAAALGKVHAERVAQQIAAFGGLAQFVAHQAGVRACGGQRFVDVGNAVPEIVAVHLLRDAAQFLKFLPRRARLCGQLVRRLLIVRAQLDDLFCARQRRSGQRCDGGSGSFQPGLHRAARDVARRAHGVGQPAVVAFGVFGGVALFAHGAFGVASRGSHAVGGAVGLLGRVGQRRHVSVVFLDLVPDLVHRVSCAIQGDLQVFRLLAVLAVFCFRLVQLFGDQLHLFGVRIVHALQVAGLGPHGLHAVGLIAEGAVGRGHFSVQHRQPPADVLERFFIFLVAQHADSRADAFAAWHVLTSLFAPMYRGLEKRPSYRRAQNFKLCCQRIDNGVTMAYNILERK